MTAGTLGGDLQALVHEVQTTGTLAGLPDKHLIDGVAPWVKSQFS